MLYYVILGRDPDSPGLAFWKSVADSGGPGVLFQGSAGYTTRIQILGPGTPNQGFIGSPEFQGLFASSPSQSCSDAPPTNCTTDASPVCNNGTWSCPASCGVPNLPACVSGGFTSNSQCGGDPWLGGCFGYPNYYDLATGQCVTPVFPDDTKVAMGVCCGGNVVVGATSCPTTSGTAVAK